MYQANGTYYTEEHSISFGEIVYNARIGNNVFDVLANTWTDWHLIPSSRPSIANPDVVNKFIEIPGYDGLLDLTEYLSGKPNYGQRKGTLSFIVDNGHESWETIRQKIVNFFHGKSMKMRLDDCPDYYYVGRFKVGNLESGADHSKISIEYTLNPFKYKIEMNGSDYPMIWDTFNFETDYDYSSLYPSVVITNNITRLFVLHSEEYSFVPTVTLIYGNVTFTFGGITRTLTVPDSSVELGKSSYGANTLIVTGTGVFKINWRGGSL